MAERTPVARYPGEFSRVIIGSTIHGLSVAGTDDLDLMGVMIENPFEAIGLNQPLEQHVWRTQPEGVPSGVGDIDLTVYTLRKFLRLVANGNPTVLNLLFVAPDARHLDTFIADELRSLTPKIVSREAGFRYRGYLRAQRERLTGERGQKHTGKTRREKYMSADGWDTKYAMHMVRLGLQGVELLQTGRITLPMQEPQRTEVMNVRLGKYTEQQAIDWALELENQITGLIGTSHLPEHPDRVALDNWMIKTYLKEWTGKSYGRI